MLFQSDFLLGGVMAFLVYGLATYRLSSLLSSESGPFGILDKFRYFIGVRYNEYSVPYGTNVIANGIICLWCNSVWIGMFITLAHIFFGQDIVLYTCFPFALSAVAIVVNASVTQIEDKHE